MPLLLGLVLCMGVCFHYAHAEASKFGMELWYEGKIESTTTYKNEPPSSYSQKLTLVVLLLNHLQGEKPKVIQIKAEKPQHEEVFRHTYVHIGSVSADGKFVPAPYLQELPLVFISPKRLKLKGNWNAEEALVAGIFRHLLKAKVNYCLVGQSTVDGNKCWLLVRHLPKPFKVTHEFTGETYIVSMWTDWFWVDAQTGLVRKWKQRRKFVAQDAPDRYISTDTLEVSLKQVKTFDKETSERLRSDFRMLYDIQNMLDKLEETEEQLDRAEKELVQAREKLRDNPYAPFIEPYLEYWFSTVQIWKRHMEAKKLVGKPAPDFELPTIDGKGKIKLSDLRGKIIVLNFFAYW